MKKQITLILLSLLGLTAQGQNTFAPIGAEWYYLDNSHNAAMGPTQQVNTWIDKMIVEKDTIYNGISCKKHVVTRTIKYFNNPVAQLDTTFYQYSYNDGDTVKMFDTYTHSFKPLYVFNLSPGDTVCVSTFREPNSFYPDSNFCYVVDSVLVVMYSGEPLKTYYTNAIINQNYQGSINFGEGGFNFGSDWNHPGIYVERLGAGIDRTGLFPALSVKAVDGTPDRLSPSGTIKCYLDTQLTYKTSLLPCDSFEGRGTNVIDHYANNLGITLYPNPALDKINFTSKTIFNDATQITIFELSGRLVWSTILASNSKVWTIDLPSLNKGMYVVKVKNSNGLMQQKLLIE